MVELQEHVGVKFRKTYFGGHQEVVLREVKKDKVVLQEPGVEHTFKLPLSKFNKFYKKV